MNRAAEGKAEEVQNNGVLPFDPDNLPLGYRFCPTDIELLIYLSKKIHRQPLPPNNIPQVNLYSHHPEQLAGRYKAEGEKVWYYFTPRERKYANGQRPKRSIEDGDGYWKATGAEQEIIKSSSPSEEEEEEEDGRKIVIGYKRALVFYQGKHPHGVKTNWIMHEFRLAAAHPPPTSDHDIVNHNNKKFDDYVLCRVYKNNRSDRGSKRSRDIVDQPRINIDIASTSASSSKIPKVFDGDSPNETENQVTASGGGGTEYMEENPTTTENGSYNHHSLQNQHQQARLIDHEIPLNIPGAYATSTTSVFPHNYLQLLNLPPAGADVFWRTHSNDNNNNNNNNNNLMQSSDFTSSLNPPWEMSTDFYAKNVCNGSGLICSTMDLNPGGEVGGCGCYSANSNIHSTTMPSGDMWGNTFNANIDSHTLPMPMPAGTCMNLILDTPFFTPNEPMTYYQVLKIGSDRPVRSVRPSIEDLSDPVSIRFNRDSNTTLKP